MPLLPLTFAVGWLLYGPGCDEGSAAARWTHGSKEQNVDQVAEGMCWILLCQGARAAKLTLLLYHLHRNCYK